MNKKYIDVDKFKKESLTWLDGTCLVVAVEELDRAPAADVVEVKHAKWEISSDGYYPYCTNCGYEPPWVGGKDMRTPYCPDCGAIMDGGVE